MVWGITAIEPYDVEAWVLEQIATVMCIALIWWAARSVEFSPSALLGLSCLFILHAIGTHYTYSLTPYDDFGQATFNISINELFDWQRNHYDRLVHFAFGLATAKPFFEFLTSHYKIQTNVAWFLALNLAISASAIYELLEWWAAVIFSSETGALYLGSQGDIWDAQWDIALAAAGFSVSYLLQLLVEKCQRSTQ